MIPLFEVHGLFADSAANKNSIQEHESPVKRFVIRINTSVPSTTIWIEHFIQENDMFLVDTHEKST